MMKYHAIHHLAMVTGDMDSTVRFWRDLLGMRLVVGMGKPGYRHYFFEVSEKTFLAFFEWPGAEPVPEKDHGYPVRGPIVFDHVSFGVSEEADLLRLKRRLDAAGFWASEIIDHGFIHSVYSFDPNGIPIEFSCAAGDVDVHAHPILRDSAPSGITLEGPDPVGGRWPAPDEAIDEAEEVFPGEGKDLLLRDGKNRWER